jgi:hypothetical protein
VAESTPAVCTDAEMVDIFKASITTEVPNISENEKRLLHYFLNWVENQGMHKSVPEDFR